MLIILVVYEKKIIDLNIFSSEVERPVNVFIYDNSRCSQEIPVIENVTFYYSHDSTNSGVSRAYNKGAEFAKTLGLEKVLLLDQDSKFNFNSILKYEEMYEIYCDQYIYAPIVINKSLTKVYSPAFLSRFVGKPQVFDFFKYEEVASLCGKSLINSGLMIPLEVFDKVGGFNEKLKLDFSDVYFVEKYKKLNLTFILINVYLEHSLSGDEGLNYQTEYSRFRFYCYSAREMGRSLRSLVIYSPVRRLFRLILKYKKINFVFVFFRYFVLGKEV